MAPPFDLENKHVRTILDQAKAAGKITDEQLSSIIRPGAVTPDEIDEIFDTLAAMGIEACQEVVENEEESDAAFLKSLRARGARGLPMPQLNAFGWECVIRALDREKAKDDQAGDR